MSDDFEFSPEAIAFADEYPTLGPAYHEAREVCEAFMAKFQAEQLKPIIEKAASDFQDKLWSDLETFLLSDVENNLAGSMRRTVDATVRALLTGETWALRQYPLSELHDGQKIREAVLTHCRDQLTDMRVSELEIEVERLKKDLDWARKRDY